MAEDMDHMIPLRPSSDVTSRMILTNLARQTGSVIFEYDIKADRAQWFGDTLAVLGYTPDQLAPMGKEAWNRMIHPDDQERASAAVREAFAHRDRLFHEYRFKHAGGRYIYVEESATIARNPDGSPVYSLVMMRDITSRWEALTALAESERRFRATFEYAAIGIHHVAPDGHYLRINPRFCEIVGYSERELRSLNFQDITHPDDLAADLEYVRRLLAGEQLNYVMEKRYIRKDGSPVWVNLSVTLVRKSNGEPDYFVSMVEDISQRRTALDALAESEQRFRATFDQAAVGIHHVTPSGRYVRFNQRFCDIVGYARAELEALNVRDITHPDDIPREERLARLLLSGRRPTFATEKRYVRKDRSEVWVNVTVSLVRKPDGRPDYLVSVVEDISDRVAAQAALHANQRALEAKNIALREVVAQIDAEKRELQQHIRSNIERTVRPIILRLTKQASQRDQRLLKQLESNLEQIVSPMTRLLETEFSTLSPRELEVCSLIRNGMTSKEIAEALSVSQETVNKFRHFIRKKLGITNEEVNLRSYLRLLDRQIPK